jgi:hypothetical protein
MLASSPFASNPLAWSPQPLSVTLDSIAFDGYGLQNAGICVTEADFENSGPSEMNQYPLPRTDGNGFLSRFWRKKTVTLRGFAKADSKADLDALIDSVKRNLYGTEGILQYSDANGTRKIVATLSAANFDRQHFHLTFCPFVLTFETNPAFWYDSENQSYSFAMTSGTRAEQLDADGSAPSSPRVYFAFVTASAVTSVSFSANSRTVTVSGTFSAGDILLIDCENKSVVLNGTETDYSGTFPEFAQGPNSVSYSVNGTATLDVVNIWKKNYL